MDNKPSNTFEKTEINAVNLAKSLNLLLQEIAAKLPDGYQSEIKDLSDKLDAALAQLISELRNPVLTVATAGTTSSGKSTLINMLCGAEIVPVAVREMSAGTVIIEYNDQKSLEIKATQGARWECGIWHGLSEQDIYDRLHQTMTEYMDHRDTDPNMACPQAVIQYPFRLLKQTLLDIPLGTRVRILDLPGLAYVGDAGNISVIKQCRDALCIVAYDSAETDPNKVAGLLQEVVEQVKELRGSPARMLFVLNKIDVFRRDPDLKSEERFVTSTTVKIKKQLAENLREYTQEIEQLNISKLSTLPALLAIRMQSEDENNRIDACRYAKNHFTYLAPDVLGDLSSNAQRWSPHDRSRAISSLWEQSNAEVFHQTLKHHIRQHFPQLVIPQVINRFNISIGHLIEEWLTHTAKAILETLKGNHQEELKKLEDVRKDIQLLLEENTQKLRTPFEDIKSKTRGILEDQTKDDPTTFIESTLKKMLETEPYKQLGAEKLYPFYGWRRELGNGADEILDAVADSLINGNIQLLKAKLKQENENVQLLSQTVRTLVRLGYTGTNAKNGMTIKAETESEKTNLKWLNDELNQLADIITRIIEKKLRKISDNSLHRIYQSMYDLLLCHLSDLEKSLKRIAPHYIINLPKSQLSKVKGNIEFNLKLEAGFPIIPKEIEEKIKKKRTGWIGWALGGWIIDIILGPKIEIRKRKQYNAEIPSIGDCLSGWAVQVQLLQFGVADQITQWQLDQIDVMTQSIDDVQKKIFENYKKALRKAEETITNRHAAELSFWDTKQKDILNLQGNFENLSTVLIERH